MLYIVILLIVIVYYLYTCVIIPRDIVYIGLIRGFTSIWARGSEVEREVLDAKRPRGEAMSSAPAPKQPKKVSRRANFITELELQGLEA